MEKDEESEELISQPRKQKLEYKKGLGSISNFKRRRIFKSWPPELDQFVKLSKDNLLLIKKKVYRKNFYTKKEIKCK